MADCPSMRKKTLSFPMLEAFVFLRKKKIQFAHSDRNIEITKVGGTGVLFVKSSTGEVFVFWESKSG
jgi:hypothetical protein